MCMFSKSEKSKIISEKNQKNCCHCKYCQNIYKPIKRLGNGGYGVSYLCEEKYTKNHYVFKSISVHSINEANDALTEVYFLQKLRHPNIVHYEEFFLHQDMSLTSNDMFKVIIIMEYCNTGDLYTLITNTYKNNCPYSDSLILCFIQQLCNALSFIHEYDIVHRDIKPDNIFICNNTSIRLGDFGLARILSDSILSTINSLSITGTQLYRAPEMDNQFVYDKRSDVWSLGIVILELLNWKCYDIDPHNKCYYTQEWINDEIECIHSTSIYIDSYKYLLHQMLVINPQNRISMDDIIQLSFLSSFNYNH